ncbi:hypothetical protein SP047_004304 [Salmonella enterica]|nr:hypothetical protein [Salmonella enterica]ELY9536611.1 hypothetical protein [Salmonella enterica]ELY9572351.1 hypothetical protein [Salmonella enterica]
MKNILFLLSTLISTTALANQGAMISQCGNFTLVAKVGEMTKVNGETVTSQKITELGNNGLKVDMTLMPARDGNMYGFEYVHPDGSNKRWLNVELIRGNMNEPRIIGTFDCKRVSG